jgi:hypothetical protein
MTKLQDWKALDSKVIVVASATVEVGDFVVYIGAVAGEDHEAEWKEVYKHGTKVDYEVAKALFPEFADKYHWRQ